MRMTKLGPVKIEIRTKTQLNGGRRQLRRQTEGKEKKKEATFNFDMFFLFLAVVLSTCSSRLIETSQNVSRRGLSLLFPLFLSFFFRCVMALVYRPLSPPMNW